MVIFFIEISTIYDSISLEMSEILILLLYHGRMSRYRYLNRYIPTFFLFWTE